MWLLKLGKMSNRTRFLGIQIIVMGIFLACATSCEKEIKESTESGTVSSSFKSKWVRSDENTGMYIDFTGDYPIFCSSSDWTKFDFSKIVGVNPNTIQFTITNPATGGYYTLRCIKTSETEMELITHESSYANDFTGGYYTKTNEWCNTSNATKWFLYVKSWPSSKALALPLNLYRYPYNSGSKSYGSITKMYRSDGEQPEYGDVGTISITDEIFNYSGKYVLRDQQGVYTGGLFEIRRTYSESAYKAIVIEHR
jgi:hypothetical protein